MYDFKQITPTNAKEMMDSKDVNILDIRDPHSFAEGHIEQSIHLSNENVQQFVNSTDHETPLIVCCYHENSSQGAAQYFAENGFKEVYSLAGGFEAWRHQFSHNITD